MPCARAEKYKGFPWSPGPVFAMWPISISRPDPLCGPCTASDTVTLVPEQMLLREQEHRALWGRRL